MLADRRRPLPWRLPALGFIALLGVLPALAQPEVPAAPVAKRVARVTEIHGDKLVDHYYWLRQKQDPEVIDYLKAENAYTDAVMKPTLPLQERLYKEFVGRTRQTDLSVPVADGAYVYWTRTEEGKQYPIHCRKLKNTDVPEQVLLDVNELARGHKFFSVNVRLVSDDGHLLAYTSDTTGFRDYTLHVKDLRTGTLLADKLVKVRTVAWAADNRTLFYVTEDEAKRPYRLYRHKLGDAQEKDVLLHEEKDELYNIGLSQSKDRRYAFLDIASSTTTEVHYVKRDRPEDRPRVIVPRAEDHRYHVEHLGGKFLIRTNRAAKNFRLVTAPVATPGPEHWQELIPHRPEVLLDDVHVFADFLVLEERFGGLDRLAVLQPSAGAGPKEGPKVGPAGWGRIEIAFEEPTYALAASANPEFGAGTFRFEYQSFTTPKSVFEYDIASGKRRLLKETEVPGGYDRGHYVSERLWATAPDGVKVPISVVRKKDVKLDGAAPLLLHGYGAYGYPSPATFNETRFSLLDRGVIFAIAHIRGGGEMGEPWHDDGKVLKKRNSFTDFIACAEHLFAHKYTRRDRLAIQGRSAGGLLIGAVLTLRPDLARVAVLEVPFLEVINTMLDETLPLTVPEFLEWGNPKDPRHYPYMKSYCPYTNLHATTYPAMLVATSFHDSQVMYWEPAKYVAKLRSVKKDTNPLLFKCNMDAGHGGASGRYDAWRERAFVTAFVLTRLGVEK